MTYQLTPPPSQTPTNSTYTKRDAGRGAALAQGEGAVPARQRPARPRQEGGGDVVCVLHVYVCLCVSRMCTDVGVRLCVSRCFSASIMSTNVFCTTIRATYFPLIYPKPHQRRTRRGLWRLWWHGGAGPGTSICRGGCSCSGGRGRRCAMFDGFGWCGWLKGRCLSRFFWGGGNNDNRKGTGLRTRINANTYAHAPKKASPPTPPKK